jgi:hypothetical protein
VDRDGLRVGHGCEAAIGVVASRISDPRPTVSARRSCAAAEPSRAAEPSQSTPSRSVLESPSPVPRHRDAAPDATHRSSDSAVRRASSRRRSCPRPYSARDTERRPTARRRAGPSREQGEREPRRCQAYPGRSRAAALLPLVHLTSKRTVEAVRQDCPFVEKEDSRLRSCSSSPASAWSTSAETTGLSQIRSPAYADQEKGVEKPLFPSAE